MSTIHPCQKYKASTGFQERKINIGSMINQLAFCELIFSRAKSVPQDHWGTRIYIAVSPKRINSQMDNTSDIKTREYTPKK